MRGINEAICLGDLKWAMAFDCISLQGLNLFIFVLFSFISVFSTFPFFKTDPGARLDRPTGSCGPPPSILNAQIDTRYSSPSLNYGIVGQAVHYQCRAAHAMHGFPEVFCNADYSWMIRFRCIQQTSD